MLSKQQEDFLAQITAWGHSQPAVRAMLLTSTLAIPDGYVDILSDYDIILILDDITPFHAERVWLTTFGAVLASYRDPIEDLYGFLSSGYVIQFENNLKIDFSLWVPGILRHITALPQLPDELDAGYRILLDKDGLTDALQPPTYKAFIPQPPGESEYITHIENFLLDATYVAKFLWRGDLIAAHHILDEMMKQESLRPLLEWHMEIEHNWSLKPGPYLRRIQTWLRPDLLAELYATYTSLDPEETWQALYRSIALMRKTALEIAAHLGFQYPERMEQEILVHLEKVRQLEP